MYDNDFDDKTYALMMSTHNFLPRRLGNERNIMLRNFRWGDLVKFLSAFIFKKGNEVV
jgi:hypothetical protein